MITREFNLYLHAGHSIPLVINVNQYDHGEQWLFTLFNSDGTQYVPSSGAIVGIKSDNLGIINSGSVDSNGRVVINETQQMTAAVGKAVFELLIDDQTHGTANFVVLVEPKPGDNADLSETDISLIEQAIEAASTIKPYGSPLVASTVAGMTDHDKVYVYVGSETGYTSGNWYYWDGSAWTSGGVYNSVAVQTDTTLALSGVAADAKKTGDEINDLKSQIAQSSGLTADVKQALMNCFNYVAWKNNDPNAQTYIDALQSALYPPANLSYITAVYTQGETVVHEDDSLDDLKSDLVVTAYYDDSTSEVVTNYVLSGELTKGTSVITVTYGGKTTTFNVSVSAPQGLLYRVTNVQMQIDGSVLETGIMITDVDKDFSIAFDADVTEYTNNVRFIDALETADPWQGILVSKTNNKTTLNLRYYNNYSAGATIPSVPFRLRFVLTHTIGTNNMIVAQKFNTSSITKTTVTGTRSDKTTGSVHVGGYTTSQFTGTVNSLYIYNRVLTQAEIDAYLGD